MNYFSKAYHFKVRNVGLQLISYKGLREGGGGMHLLPSRPSYCKHLFWGTRMLPSGYTHQRTIVVLFLALCHANPPTSPPFHPSPKPFSVLGHIILTISQVLGHIMLTTSQVFLYLTMAETSTFIIGSFTHLHTQK